MRFIWVISRVLVRLVIAGVVIVVISGSAQRPRKPAKPTIEIPKGVLVNEIPEQMDIIFSSIRYVLDDAGCLDRNGQVKRNFIGDRHCNKKIWQPKYGFTSPREVFTMDIDTSEVVQITNIGCHVDTVQVIDFHKLMILAACRDTNRDGIISDKDKVELYILNLMTEERDCLTCGLGIESMNNPDYSSVNKKIVFSARRGRPGSPHYIFTVDKDKNFSQITRDPDYMDFDSGWSEDATKIVFNRLSKPFSKTPSQIWLMDADGSNVEQITSGGLNPYNEKRQRGYLIGTDADPDLSPDNKKIVFSRLRTGGENPLFGVYELVVIDVETKEIEILDSQYANMLPQWKSKGILFIRQMATGRKIMDRKQFLCIYRDGEFKKLEEFPFEVYPMGGFGQSWIE